MCAGVFFGMAISVCSRNSHSPGDSCRWLSLAIFAYVRLFAFEYYFGIDA